MSRFVEGTPFFNDAVAGTKVTLKAAAAKIHGLKLVNTTGATAYLQLFDKLAADVTVGTTVPDWCIRLAANESTFLPFELPAGFKTGIVMAGCTSPTNNTGAAISVTAVYE